MVNLSAMILSVARAFDPSYSIILVTQFTGLSTQNGVLQTPLPGDINKPHHRGMSARCHVHEY